jgi:hypothetical protein
MSAHRTYFMDKELLYLFSVNLELSSDIEPIGIVPGGARANIFCVPNNGRVYNILRERTLGANGYPAITGTVKSGEDDALLREDDVVVANVRAIIQTDDGTPIDTAYMGVVPMGMGAFRGIVGGSAKFGTDEEPFETSIVVTPRYETGNVNYQWLTEQQCVGFGRVQAVKGKFRRVSYDIYAMG